MTFAIQTPSLGFPPIAEFIPTSGDYVTPPPYGTIVTAADPYYGSGEFIFLKGAASTVRGSVVVYSPDDFTTALASTSTTGDVAVAMAATVANKAGWYQITGKAVMKAGTVADNAKVWATATPGTVDDATADGYLIHKAWFASADGTPSTGLAEAEINRPYIDGIATND